VVNAEEDYPSQGFAPPPLGMIDYRHASLYSVMGWDNVYQEALYPRLLALGHSLAHKGKLSSQAK
jgi:hypothetical protein